MTVIPWWEQNSLYRLMLQKDIIVSGVVLIQYPEMYLISIPPQKIIA